MKALVDVRPTPEQLALLSRIRPGVEIIRGAAGSGKTTTALLKLRAAVGFYINRAAGIDPQVPVSVLVLTFNRTLRGYVKELAEQQLGVDHGVKMDISTFSGWAGNLVGWKDIIDVNDVTAKITSLARKLPFDSDFVADEVAYVLGKYEPRKLADYLTSRRTGRGSLPRMDTAARETLLREVINPYLEYKEENEIVDWNDLACHIASKSFATYDVVVVDEAQDFSANEIRAIIAQLSKHHTVTFVLDTTQRIYSRSNFTWQEVGLIVRPENSHQLSINYRNTIQIARFAAGILAGMVLDGDGTMPNFASASRVGPLPVVVTGKFSKQLDYAISYIHQNINLSENSVAFLHAKGGGWFRGRGSIVDKLDDENLPFVEISRRSDWPAGPENIALSTLHSAKGLEFDYVFILGLNAEVMPDGVEEDGEPDSEPLDRLRRLVAMGVGRAR